MDPIGATASLVTLVGLAVKTYKLINTLVKSYRDVPAELAALESQIRALKCQLFLLRYAHEAVTSNELDFSEVETTMLNDVLKETSIIFSKVGSHFGQQSKESGSERRLRWVLRDASKVKEWEYLLSRQSFGLTNILLLINARYSAQLKNECQDIKDSIETIPSLIAPSRPSDKSRFMWSKSKSLPRLKGSVRVIQKHSQHEYNLALKFGPLFLSKALNLNLKFLRAISLSTSASFAIRISLRLHNVVPVDSPIISACENGDTSAVWDLFQAGAASVHDITPDNVPVLAYAIRSGSNELVSFLISKGADVRATYGLHQSSPIQTAFAARKLGVARLLIANGADLHHISAMGWTPAFRLFSRRNNTLKDREAPVDEFLEILKSSEFDEFDSRDPEGWSCMHRAAVYGKAQDIAALLKLKASSTLRTTNLLWTPIFCAVQFGNISTFNELRKHHADFLTLKDVRHWSLLHVAVGAKRIDMIRLLIDLGADPHSQSLPKQFLVSEELKGRAVTPGDIARLRGPQIFSAYTEALKTAGHQVDVVKDETDNEENLFWPALEAH